MANEECFFMFFAAASHSEAIRMVQKIFFMLSPQQELRRFEKSSRLVLLIWGRQFESRGAFALILYEDSLIKLSAKKYRAVLPI
jgi:hypothetical protein